jgi:hypothetical protein
METSATTTTVIKSLRHALLRTGEGHNGQYHRR